MLLFLVAFTHLRDSTRSSGEDARLGPAKESDTVFQNGTGNGMCFGFQFKKIHSVGGMATAKALRWSVKQHEQNQEVNPA